MTTNFSPFPKLTTNRLMLRQLKTTDAPALLILRSNDDVNKYLNRPKTTSMDATNAFIAKIENHINKNESIYWAITQKNDVLIGTICLYNFQPQTQLVEIGYELLPDYWGKGLISETISTVLEYAFTSMLVKTITAFSLKENLKSAAVLLKNNFILDDTLGYCTIEEAEVCHVFVKSQGGSHGGTEEALRLS